MGAEDFAADVPLDLARRAHEGTSHDPEQRAEQERGSYARGLAQDFQNLLHFADSEAKQATLAEEFARYRVGYRQRFLAYLEARSRCLSVLVTGPSNFPTARNAKRNRTSDKRVAELVDYRARALAAIRRALTPEEQPIRSGDPDAIERLRAEIAALESTQDRMRRANAAIRKHRGAYNAAIAIMEN
jgi:hypothetical protein